MSQSSQEWLTASPPWKMTQAEWLAANPPVTRSLQRYSSEARADHAASHRLGYLQRKAIGEYFYMNPIEPNRCYPTAKAAKVAWHLAAIRMALQQGRSVSEQVLADYPFIKRG